MTTPDDFDASRLRRLDRPHRPGPDADDAIRARMLDAFDHALEADAQTSGVEPSTGVEPSEIPVPRDDEVPDDQPVVIEIDLQRRDGPAPDRGRSWGYRAAVAAAIAVLVGVGAILILGDDEPADLAGTDEEVVAEFCTSRFAELVVIFDAFHADPTGEIETRALRNLELLAQAYADLADDLNDPLADTVRLQGAELLDEAAEARRAVTLERGGEEELAALVENVAARVSELPGSSSCDLDRLRGA